MKKFSAFIGLVALLFVTTNVQGQSFQKGDNALNVTIGFGTASYTYGWASSTYSSSPVFAVSLDHCFWDELINGDFSVGIGGYFGFYTSKYRWAGDRGFNYTYLIPAARGTFHWTGVENLDLYAGVHLGAKIEIASKTGDHPFDDPSSVNPFYGAAFVGARYYFTDAFGVTAELGSGSGWFNAGVCFKF